MANVPNAGMAKTGKGTGADDAQGTGNDPMGERGYIFLAKGLFVKGIVTEQKAQFREYEKGKSSVTVETSIAAGNQMFTVSENFNADDSRVKVREKEVISFPKFNENALVEVQLGGFKEYNGRITFTRPNWLLIK